jgi:hypothetical protein
MAATPSNVWIGGSNQLFTYDGMNWLDAGLPFANLITTSMTWSPPNLWVFRSSSNVYEFNTANTLPDAPTTILASAPKSGGGAWLAGGHGMVADLSPSGVVTPLQNRVPSYPIRNLFVTNAVQLVALDDLILTRNVSQGWSTFAPLSNPVGHQWMAVVAVNDPGLGMYVFWALDQSGSLYRSTFLGPASLVARFKPPYIDYHPRSAATVALNDGSVLLGVGSAIVRLTGSEVFTVDGARVDGGAGAVQLEYNDVPLTMISGLASSGTELVASGHISTGNANNDYSRVYKRSLSSADAGWTLIATSGAGQRIDDVSACPNGSFVFAGDHQILSRIAPSATNATSAYTTTPVDVDFASVWCGPNNEAWALTRHGDVFRYATDQTLVRERTGWGRVGSFNDTVRACTIRGNSSTLFISGGSEAVLSRPLCP